MYFFLVSFSGNPVTIIDTPGFGEKGYEKEQGNIAQLVEILKNDGHHFRKSYCDCILNSQ